MLYAFSVMSDIGELDSIGMERGMFLNTGNSTNSVGIIDKSNIYIVGL